MHVNDTVMALKRDRQNQWENDSNNQERGKKEKEKERGRMVKQKKVTKI